MRNKAGIMYLKAIQRAYIGLFWLIEAFRQMITISEMNKNTGLFSKDLGLKPAINTYNNAIQKSRNSNHRKQ